jgi:hypothetical protein
MLATLLFILAGLNYALQIVRNRRVNQLRNPDSAMALDLQTELYAGRPIRPAWNSAQRRLFEPSDDPVIEHQRRLTLAAFSLALAVGLAWLVAPAALDQVVQRAASVTPLAAGVPVVALTIASVTIWSLVSAAVGPLRQPLPIIAAGVGAFASFAVFAASPALLGAD